ncbi:hypothetical protein GGX14DRAFT_618859 [Mycena pura]|uniref:Uncharacterized protein n=1 Tax=Mycena pura TaxID=153505 RepID=A0AAD6VQE2_9AGAR|nr:hypothetical protein GGX14DRAFT_618859 [Mycena pura]
MKRRFASHIIMLPESLVIVLADESTRSPAAGPPRPSTPPCQEGPPRSSVLPQLARSGSGAYACTPAALEQGDEPVMKRQRLGDEDEAVDHTHRTCIDHINYFFDIAAERSDLQDERHDEIVCGDGQSPALNPDTVMRGEWIRLRDEPYLGCIALVLTESSCLVERLPEPGRNPLETDVCDIADLPSVLHHMHGQHACVRLRLPHTRVRARGGAATAVAHWDSTAAWAEFYVEEAAAAATVRHVLEAVTTRSAALELGSKNNARECTMHGLET